MKSLYWLVFAIPFLLTCKKEEIDSVYNVIGIVTDGSSGDPIVGLPLTAYQSSGGVNAAWNGELEVLVLDTEVTAGDGRFDIMVDKTRLESKYLPLTLGCTSIPAGYQRYVRIDNYEIKDLFLDVNDFYANSDQFDVNDNSVYSLQLFQLAYFNLVIPPLTQDMKQDTLVLHLSTSKESITSFHLGNNWYLQSLQEVRSLVAADRAVGTYQLRRGTVIKSGSFDVFCPPHDTTAVYLDL